MSGKPRISIPVNAGKSEKLVVSFDAALMAEIKQYIKYTASTYGSDEISPTKMLKLITEAFLNEDKEFAAWKKKVTTGKSNDPVATSNAETAPASSNDNNPNSFYVAANG